MAYEEGFYSTSAEFILGRLPRKPDVALVLGSALGSLADTMTERVEIPYAEIPNFLLSTAPLHAGKLVCGQLSGHYVACMSGRFHYYEGYSFEQLASPVRVLRLLGAQTLLLTNAAGAVNTSFRVGDIMLISDHIKLTGASPMRGPNLDCFGPRFFDASAIYTPALRSLARDCAERLGQADRVREGVYFFMTGPQYETPAEIRAIRLLGGDAVGMSTVTESLTAAHCSMRVLAMSLITNMAAGVLPQPLSQEEVEAAGRGAAGRFSALVTEIVRSL